jgi:hypothetical protein
MDIIKEFRYDETNRSSIRRFFGLGDDGKLYVRHQFPKDSYDARRWVEAAHQPYIWMTMELCLKVAQEFGPLISFL